MKNILDSESWFVASAILALVGVLLMGVSQYTHHIIVFGIASVVCCSLAAIYMTLSNRRRFKKMISYEGFKGIIRRRKKFTSAFS